MANYCVEKGIICENSNKYGNCAYTCCTKLGFQSVTITCGQCGKTDGMCYTTNPPKVKCTITGHFHFYNDSCDCLDQRSGKLSTLNNECELCGNETEDTYHHICKSCREKINKVIEE